MTVWPVSSVGKSLVLITLKVAGQGYFLLEEILKFIRTTILNSRRLTSGSS